MSRLRLATFNLESLDDRPGLDPPLAARIAILRPQLRRLEADVLCLQEVNGQEGPAGAPRRLAALDALLADTPYRDFARAWTVTPDGDPADVHNLVTLSRLPVLERRQYRHELVPPPAYRPVTAGPPGVAPAAVEWDRPALYTALDLGGGRRLHVVNLHLRSPLASFVPGQKDDAATWRSVPGWAEGLFLSGMKRAGQALEVRMVVDRLFDSDPEALVAVCGDFNAELHETPVRILRGDEADTGSGRLAGRVLVPVEHAVPESLRYTVRHHGHRAMLDHVLVSRTLLARFRHAEIHNEALEDELVAERVAPRAPDSFHAPMMAEFADA